MNVITSLVVALTMAVLIGIAKNNDDNDNNNSQFLGSC